MPQKKNKVVNVHMGVQLISLHNAVTMLSNDYINPRARYNRGFQGRKCLKLCCFNVDILSNPDILRQRR